MKTAIVVLCIVFGIITVGCTSRPKQHTVTGDANSTIKIEVAYKENVSDTDTVIYELPQCQLWYTENLPDKYKDKAIGMWTERKNYPEDVQFINVFVINPTDIPFKYGRAWNLYVWDGKKWDIPQLKIPDLVWNQDLFVDNKAPLLHYFRFPVGEYYHLPKGKYRLTKTFGQDGKETELTADFNILD